jgi:hypothetical protein
MTMTDEKKIEYLLQYLDTLDDLNRHEFKCNSEIKAAIDKVQELLEIKKSLSINVDVALDVDKTFATTQKGGKILNNSVKHLLDNVKADTTYDVKKRK